MAGMPLSNAVTFSLWYSIIFKPFDSFAIFKCVSEQSGNLWLSTHQELIWEFLIFHFTKYVLAPIMYFQTEANNYNFGLYLLFSGIFGSFKQPVHKFTVSTCFFIKEPNTWDVPLCTLVDMHQHFQRNLLHPLYPEDESRGLLWEFSTYLPNTLHHIWDNGHLKSEHCQSLTSLLFTQIIYHHVSGKICV